jgi:hypothetical protein
MWINIIALRDEAIVYMEVAATRFAAVKLIGGSITLGIIILIMLS